MTREESTDRVGFNIDTSDALYLINQIYDDFESRKMTKKEYEAIQYVTMEAIFGNSDGDKLRESVKIVEEFLMKEELKDEKQYTKNFQRYGGGTTSR